MIMDKVVDITAKRDGFRRAGMVHSDVTKTYPLSDFTKSQLKQLQAEPMLVVAIRDRDSEAATGVIDGLRLQVSQLAKDVLTLTGQKFDARQQAEKLDGELKSTRAALDDTASALEAERQKTADLTAQLAAVKKPASKGK